MLRQEFRARLRIQASGNHERKLHCGVRCGVHQYLWSTGKHSRKCYCKIIIAHGSVAAPESTQCHRGYYLMQRYRSTVHMVQYRAKYKSQKWRYISTRETYMSKEYKRRYHLTKWERKTLSQFAHPVTAMCYWVFKRDISLKTTFPNTFPKQNTY